MARETLFPFYFRHGERRDNIDEREGEGFELLRDERGENRPPRTIVPHGQATLDSPAQQSSRSENNRYFSFIRAWGAQSRHRHPVDILMTSVAYLIDDSDASNRYNLARCAVCDTQISTCYVRINPDGEDRFQYLRVPPFRGFLVSFLEDSLISFEFFYGRLWKESFR